LIFEGNRGFWWWKKDGAWRYWFAWYPVRDIYGRWQWLRPLTTCWSRDRWIIAP
jgi:hypothetical protein